MKCTLCDGYGFDPVVIDPEGRIKLPCKVCDGTGELPLVNVYHVTDLQIGDTWLEPGFKVLPWFRLRKPGASEPEFSISHTAYARVEVYRDYGDGEFSVLAYDAEGRQCLHHITQFVLPAQVYRTRQAPRTWMDAPEREDDDYVPTGLWYTPEYQWQERW